MYDVRQAPCNWYAKLSDNLIKYGFHQSSADHGFTYSSGQVVHVVLIYVDNLIIASNNTEACNSFKTYLHNCFRMKDLGDLKYFLGLKLARGPEGFYLCQRMHLTFLRSVV